MAYQNKIKKPFVSIIIRTKNEERWINSCLNAVFAQNYKNFEVIIVDNYSKDTTLSRLSTYDLKIIKIKQFIPGKALNVGINISKGEYIVCLSGHCIPTNKYWLENLIKDLSKKDVAGIYGRQEPLPYSDDVDKRDLINLFGVDKKIQIKEPFFHNANSAFKKKTWLKFKFDEILTNIEDRAWGQNVINHDLKIIYEPLASVYHWHGVNHGLDPNRTKSVVKVLEKLNNFKKNIDKNIKQKIYAFIPIKGKSKKINDTYLINLTISTLKKSKIFDEIFVITDDIKTANIAKENGANIPFIRPKYLSKNYMGVVDVIQYAYNEITKTHDKPDLIGIFEEIYPFRDLDTLKGMLNEIKSEKYDTMIATKYEPRGIFINNKEVTKTDLDRFMPSKLKRKKIFVSLLGYATFISPKLIISGEIIGNKVGIFPLSNPLGHITIKTNQDIKLFKSLLK